MPGSPDPNLLLELARHFSPLIELTSTRTAVMDLSGLSYVFGTSDEIASRISLRAKQLTAEINIVVARNPDVAILVALNKPGVTVLDAAQEQGVLSGLPIAALKSILTCEMDGSIQMVPPLQYSSLYGISLDRADQVFETLTLWGVTTIGELADLPEDGLAETLGPEGVKLQRLARGTNERALNYFEERPEFAESKDLDSPIELIEQLAFVVSGMMHRLCSRLASQGFAASEIWLKATREDSSIYERRLLLPFPMSGAHWLSRLLMIEVESRPPAGSLKSITVLASPAKPRSTQHSLFDRLSPEPEKIELTIARLARLVGRQNVGVIEVVNDHKPDLFRLKGFSIPKRPKLLPGIHRPEGRAPAAFKLFRPPLPAQIRMRSGQLRSIKLKGNAYGIAGKIVMQSGPWLASGYWWSLAELWAREEWDVAFISGVTCRIFRNLVDGEWYVEGIYD
jgi:protein ImuB